MKFTFKKAERLCSKKLIDELFAKGKSVSVFPFKLVFFQTPLNTEFPLQVAFSVPKRNIRKAVNRNLIKRRMREAYRFNKHIIYQSLEEKNKQLAIFMIYLSKEEMSFKEIENKTILLLERLNKMV